MCCREGRLPQLLMEWCAWRWRIRRARGETVMARRGVGVRIASGCNVAGDGLLAERLAECFDLSSLLCGEAVVATIKPGGLFEE